MKIVKVEDLHCGRAGRGCSSDGQRKILTICEVPH
jgi:hypothetical protein